MRFYWRLHFYVFYRFSVIWHSFLLRVSPTGFTAEVLTRPLGLSLPALLAQERKCCLNDTKKPSGKHFLVNRVFSRGDFLINQANERTIRTGRRASKLLQEVIQQSFQLTVWSYIGRTQMCRGTTGYYLVFGPGGPRPTTSTKASGRSLGRGR
jgi:hypothetical protein